MSLSNIYYSVQRIMRNRIAHAASRHCDGVDPDNVDGFNYKRELAKFRLTGSDQLSFNRFLATGRRRTFQMIFSIYFSI